MKELSMNILDILQNSVNAKAKSIQLHIVENSASDLLEFSVKDDGKGMDQEMTKAVFDPFTTSSTTKKVGLGLPFLKIQAEMCNGSSEITSQPGKGTTVRFRFQLSHVDRPPMGDLAGTLSMMFTLHHQVLFHALYEKDGKSFEISTEQLREIMQDVPLNHPKVALGIEEFIREQLIEL